MANTKIRQEQVKGTPKCRCNNGSTQVIAHNSITKLVFNTKVYDTYNSWSTSNCEFTVPEAGYYEIYAKVAYQDIGTAEWNLYVYLDGGRISDAYMPAGAGQNYSCLTVNDIRYCTAGQKIDFRTRQKSEVNKIIATDSAFVFAYIKRVLD